MVSIADDASHRLANLRAQYSACRQDAEPSSYPIYRKEHIVGRKIAATALVHDLPLASVDYISKDNLGLCLTAPMLSSPSLRHAVHGEAQGSLLRSLPRSQRGAVVDH